MQIPREVPVGSGADKIPREVFRCRYLVRFRRVPVKIPAEAPEGSCAVPEGSGADHES